MSEKPVPIDYNALLDDEILFQSEAYDIQGKADIYTPEFKAWSGGSDVVAPEQAKSYNFETVKP